MSGQTFGPFSKSVSRAPCSGQLIHTQLISPNEEVLEKLQKNSELSIVVLAGKPIIVAVFKDEIAGVILNKDTIWLLHCLKKGFQFIAVVRSVYGGMCAITIKSIATEVHEK
jgi:hypothetical protein